MAMTHTIIITDQGCANSATARDRQWFDSFDYGKSYDLYWVVATCYVLGCSIIICLQVVMMHRPGIYACT